jgi:hypothetical protein
MGVWAYGYLGLTDLWAEVVGGAYESVSYI